MASLSGRGSALDMAALFEPRSLALIGASEREGSLGTVVLRNLLEGHFEGAIHAVNPRYRRVQGQQCYAGVGDLERPVQLAVIVTPAETVPGLLEACGQAGIRTAIILSAGFREAGERGRALEASAAKAARRYGLRFLGPNCLGLMRPSIGLNATFAKTAPKNGRIALVSQSGAVCTTLLDWAAPRDIGFSAVVSTGIAADVDFGEVLDYLVMDPLTEAIMLYVEGIHDARRFMSALRAAARVKPVIAMKAGRHAQGRRAAVSHTGALVGSDDVFDAAFNRAGVVRVRNYSDFFAVADTLHAGVRTLGNRLVIVTNGGGPGVIAADYLADKELRLAPLSEATRAKLAGLLPQAWSGANPVDVLGDADAERYTQALRLCLEDPGVDAALAIHVPQALTSPEPVAARVAELARGNRKAVLTCWMGDATMAASRALLREHGVPTYHTPESAVEAFAAAAAYHTNQQLLLQVPDPLGPQAPPNVESAQAIIESALAEHRPVLDPAESKGLLAAFHIPIVESIPAHTPAEAIAVAQEIGFPVALKIYSPDIPHKSDVGGVRLGLTNARDVRSAYRDLTASARLRRPQARITGVLVERFVGSSHGRELMLGVVNDAVFGPVISVGLGGTMVEILRDRAIGLPPLNAYLAHRMIERTRAARYLGEFRGKPAADRQAVEDALLRLSEVVCELPWVEEIDINPLLVDERGAVAIDARVAVKPVSASARQYAHMSIHPYPGNLIETFELPDGTQLRIRPIRPEDAVLERTFVDSLSDRSRYLRFGYALKKITLPMLSRFTQIDYDREMALIALEPTDEGERQIGVARYVTYPDGRGCEFAIVVSDEWQGRGVATQLMRSLIKVAGDRRLEYMEGVVLRENRNMLQFARQLGFLEEVHPEDPELMALTLRL
jgi:acetyltransferase